MHTRTYSLRSVLGLIALGLTQFIGFNAHADSTPGSYHLIKKISLPGDGGWDYLNVDSKAHRAYISRGTHVMVVDTESGNLVGDIPDTAGVHGIAIDSKLGRGYTSNGRSNTVTVFDLKTLKKIVDIPVAEGPDCIIFDPATDRVFTFNGRGKSFTAISVDTNAVIETVALPGKPEFAVSDGNGHVYNNIEDTSQIVSIDSKSLKIENTWSIAPGEGPSGIAIDSKNRRIFSVCDNRKLIVLDADSGKVVATPTIGNGPDATAFDPGTGIAFSPNGGDGTLTLLQEVSPDSYSVAATIPTEKGARTMALDSRTHHVFTVTAQTAPPAAGATQRRGRSYVPGTFALLEYGP